jgi:hypothetical protein
MGNYRSSLLDGKGSAAVESLPEKPNGSAILVSPDRGGITLSWFGPSPGPGHYAIAAFIAFWLCGWAFGWIMVAGWILQGGQQGGPVLFIIAWLGGWTIGGGFAIWQLWSMLRPAQPETVRLESELIRYHPGVTPYNPWQRRGAWGWGWDQSAISKRTPAFELARSHIPGFVLERVGERQRLCCDRGADRLEIGSSLREPEREWLHAVLQRWHTDQLQTKETFFTSSS